MKKIEMTEKQKRTIKTIGLSIGMTAGGWLTISSLSKTEIGYKIKGYVVKKLLQSIIDQNGFYFISFYGSNSAIVPHSVYGDINKALDAVINPILKEKGLL